MALEYKTVQFTNDADGIARRQIYLNQISSHGWKVVSESIEQGHMSGGQACCLASICLPLGFLAQRTASVVNITLARETSTSEPAVDNEPWATYASKFSSMSPEEKALEWVKLTDAQRQHLFRRFNIKYP